MPVNCELCLIFQQSSSESLKCPLNSSTRDSIEDKSQAYIHFLYNVQRLRDANSLPVNLNIEGHKSCQDFVAYRVVWHTSCYLKFSDSKVNRKQAHGTGGDRDKRVSVKRQELDAGKCLFCGKDQMQFKLRSFETLDSDRNVRLITTELDDTGLLAKIAILAI